MFKWFKKKKKETDERFSTMRTKEILSGIEVVKKRDKKNIKHSATFLYSYITKRTCRQLRRKGYNVEVINDKGIPGFTVSW